MITNHTAICHKTCVCKYLGLLFMHFSPARSEGSGQQSSTPGTHRSGSAPSCHVAGSRAETKGGCEGASPLPWCPHTVRTPALSCSLALWSSQDEMPAPLTAPSHPQPRCTDPARAFPPLAPG